MRACAVMIALAWSSVAVAQSAAIRITGPRTLTITAADLAAMPRTIVKAATRGQEATYEGVSMRELLTRAGVPTGEALGGRELATVVVVTGADGYRVAFAIADFDPGFTDRIAILADRRDDAPLGANALQLILTGEKRPARWVRQVATIEIESLGR